MLQVDISTVFFRSLKQVYLPGNVLLEVKPKSIRGNKRIRKGLTWQVNNVVFKQILNWIVKMDEIKQAELFKVLSVGSRIRIIDLLKQKGPLGVKQLSEALGITPSAVSQHLKILRFAGMVRSERKGYCLPYEIDEKALNHCREVLSEVCTCDCRGNGRIHRVEREEIEDDISQLKKHERKLKKELREVHEKIRKLEPEE